MAKSQETFNKKEVRNKKEKKRKDKEQKRLEKKDVEKTSNLEDMMMYVDENGNLTSTPPDPSKKKKVSLSDIEISIPKRSDMDVVDSIRKGVVSFYNDAKGFGFIKDLETQQSVFFHVNNLKDEVKENNIVSFEVEMGPKGATAVNVRKSI
jgi:cold shock CspA family protein